MVNFSAHRRRLDADYLGLYSLELASYGLKKMSREIVGVGVSVPDQEQSE